MFAGSLCFVVVVRFFVWVGVVVWCLLRCVALRGVVLCCVFVFCVFCLGLWGRVLVLGFGFVVWRVGS